MFESVTSTSSQFFPFNRLQLETTLKGNQTCITCDLIERLVHYRNPEMLSFG